MGDYIVHKAVEEKALSKKTLAGLAAPRDWIVSPKYDGCHVIFAFDDGRLVNVYSRTGESVRSMDHVAKALLEAYPWFSISGKVAVAGEAWMPGVPFNEISGKFRRHAPQPDLMFVPFDYLGFEYNDQQTSGPPILLFSDATYDERLWEFTQRDAHGPVLAVQYDTLVGYTYEQAKSFADAKAKYLKYSAEVGHYDGAILAQARGRYRVGDGKGGEFIKSKPLLSETVTVTTLFPAIGEKTGKNTLALGFPLDGAAQKVSTGLTQAEVDAFIADPPAILGKRIEVEAMGYTSGGLLREPRYKGVRSDA